MIKLERATCQPVDSNEAAVVGKKKIRDAIPGELFHLTGMRVCDVAGKRW